MQSCALCPRQCGVDRLQQRGFCQAGAQIRVARAALHHWEEPCISGSRGSGTIFFSHCTLRCVYCQNESISRGGFGRDITPARLGDIMLELQQQGAHNINLVTPTHFTPQILQALDLVRHKLEIPIVMNCGGYERVETLRMWDGYIDVYLPDLKYFDSGLSMTYSAAPDYFEYASQAILEMHRQQPQLREKEGMLQAGLIVRHLVLPGSWRDSAKIVGWLADHIPPQQFYISLMRQFTPTDACVRHPEINRKLTTYEYNKVVEAAAERGLSGFMQDKESAEKGYTPPFDLQGV